MINERDEGRHPAGREELWNESYYFNFYDPARQIGGFTRIGLQENLGTSNVWCLLIKDRKPLYSRFILNLPYTDEGLDRGVSVGGLSYKMLEPLRRFQIKYTARQIDLDLIWEALHPVKEIGGRKRGELPETIARGHYEQGGTVTGNLTFRGDSFPIQGYGMRDHSWGIRDWEGVKDWLAVWPIFGEDLIIAAIRVTLPDGNIIDTGFIFDGKQNLDIVQLEPEIRLAEDGHTQQEIALRVTDERGERYELTGGLIVNFPLPYDSHLLNEAMFEFRLGNRLGYGLFEYNLSL